MRKKNFSEIFEYLISAVFFTGKNQKKKNFLKKIFSQKIPKKIEIINANFNIYNR